MTESSYINNTKTALMELLTDKPIAYHPTYARISGGVQAGIFLTQLLYWTGRGALADGWIYKTQGEMEEETALTRREQETARRQLRACGLIEEKLAGVPATLHFRVNMERLIELLTEQSSLAESAKLDCTKAPNLFGGKRQTISENTQRIPENTFSAPKKTSVRAPNDYSYLNDGDVTYGPNNESKPRKRHKWEIPEAPFQEQLLAVCGAKWFKSGQKCKVKKLEHCFRAGDILNQGVYNQCIQQLESHTEFPDRPIPLPRSWYNWRAEQAAEHRWSVDGFIKALFNRDAIVQHCRVKLKELKIPVTSKPLAREIGIVYYDAALDKLVRTTKDGYEEVEDTSHSAAEVP